MATKQAEKNNFTHIKILHERFDVSVMQTVKDEILQATEESTDVVIDLSMVQFLDSSGLSVLISILKALNKVDGSRLKLCGLTEQPNELMQITQLYNVFNIVTDCNSIE